MSQPKMMNNGVDIGSLRETIRAVAADPSLGQFKFRALNEWLGGSRNCSIISDFQGVGSDNRTRTEPFMMMADEPPALLGTDTGANPVEFLLHALAACMTTTLAYHAAARGIHLTSITSSIEGDIDLQGFLGLRESVRKGFQQIRIHFDVTGDGDPEELKRLTQFSPVFDTVSNPVPVMVEMSVTAPVMAAAEVKAGRP